MIFRKTEKIIETSRLFLRLFNDTDAPEVAKLCNNYNLHKNTLYLPFPYSIDDALSWIKNHLDNFNNDQCFEFAITDKISGKLYGAIALSNHQKFNNGELASWVGEEYWGNGYATEAAQAILEFAFIY